MLREVRASRVVLCGRPRRVTARCKGSKDAQVQYRHGRAEFIGNGTDRGQRDDARRAYEKIIRESKIQGSQKAWRGVHDRWGEALGIRGGLYDPPRPTHAAALCPSRPVQRHAECVLDRGNGPDQVLGTPGRPLSVFDRYRWQRLVPLGLHPTFSERIWSAVEVDLKKITPPSRALIAGATYVRSTVVETHGIKWYAFEIDSWPDHNARAFA